MFIIRRLYFANYCQFVFSKYKRSAFATTKSNRKCAFLVLKLSKRGIFALSKEIIHLRVRCARKDENMKIYYQKSAENEEKAEKIENIDTNLISPNPNQPRKVFTEESILKLADSIMQYGIIQPLLVRKADESYELVAGERRLRAAKELGLKAVPCIITDITEVKSAEISIIENLLRENLNIFEQAEAIQTLIDTYGLTQEEIAARLSNSQSFVANKLRLLRFSPIEREIILKNGLTERHARALLRVSEPALRDKILGLIISEGLNVSSTDELVQSYIARKEGTKAAKRREFKDIGAFYTTINRAVSGAIHQGIDIKCRRIESDDQTEITIIVSKSAEQS